MAKVNGNMLELRDEHSIKTGCLDNCCCGGWPIVGGFKRAYLWGVEMKYEITKGSEKDFDLAPEWATLKERNASGELFFSEGHSVGCRVQGITTEHDFTIDDGNNDFTHLTLIAERRPISEPSINKSSWRETVQVGTQSVESAMKNNAQWDGEGLPPVGVECEVKGCIGDYREWKKVTVFAVRDKTVFFDHDGGWSATATHEFRPIRSTEDVARDEAIIDMLMVEGGMPDSYQPHELVAALYDAGYRKME